MIELTGIYKSFLIPPMDVLKDINLRIADGEFISITGKSGSGKTTLLYIASTLDYPTKGEVIIDGIYVSKMNAKQIHKLRNCQIGYVFQSYYLLPELTAIENVMMPTIKTNQFRTKRNEAIDLLKRFGMDETIFHHLPIQLSGGEQQRIAIARALIMKPKYIFADEPTGNLDSENAKLVMDILQDINHNDNTTVIYITHDKECASLANRTITLVDGKQV